MHEASIQHAKYFAKETCPSRQISEEHMKHMNPETEAASPPDAIVLKMREGANEDFKHYIVWETDHRRAYAFGRNKEFLHRALYMAWSL